MNIIKEGDNFNATHIKDYYHDIGTGQYNDRFIVNKFGRNGVIGTVLTPVCIGGNYRTPTAATALEFVSTSASDSAAGLGAQKVYFQGLDANFELQEEILITNGLTPVALANTYTRIFRFGVFDSGTYATQTTGSHVGELIIQEAGAGDEWARIGLVTAFGMGQSQIGAYTVPRGYKAHLLSKHITVETNKPASLFFFKRDRINEVVAPFGAMRLFEENDGIQQPFSVRSPSPIQTFDEMTDVGFLAKVTAGTASISVDFQLELIKI